MTEVVKPKRKTTWVEIIVIIIFVVIIAVILYPIFARVCVKNPYVTCISNQRQIAALCLMYVQDHEENFPAKETFWKDLEVDPSVLVCPKMRNLKKSNSKYKSNRNYYAFNTWIENKFVREFSDLSAVFLTCDSDAVNNLWYSPADTANRHGRHCIYSFADGHVESAKDDISKYYEVIVDGYELHSTGYNYYRPYLFNKKLNFPNTEPTLNNFDFTSTDFNCGIGSAWQHGPVDMFTITWDGYIKAPVTGVYKFNCTADDNLTLEITDLNTHSANMYLKGVSKGNVNGKIKMMAGSYYKFKLTFIELTGNASFTIRWTLPNGKQSRIPSSIFCNGLEAFTSN